MKILTYTGSFTERRKYTSHRYDTATSYTYAKARYLNTEVGRFLSEDPAFVNSPEKFLEDPQQQNSYSYVRNNPIKLVDPTGESATLVGTLVGAVAGAGVALYQGRSWGEVAHSAFTGAVAGAIAGLVIDTGGLAAVGLTALESATVGGALGSVGATVAGNGILGQGTSGEEASKAFVVGAATGFGAGVAGEAVRGLAGAKTTANAGENTLNKAISSDGKQTVRNSITGFTEHGADQAITRGFKTPDILKIFREGNTVDALGRYGPQTQHTLGGNTIVVNAQGKVVTLFSDLHGTAKGLGEGFFKSFQN